MNGEVLIVVGSVLGIVFMVALLWSMFSVRDEDDGDNDHP